MKHKTVKKTTFRTPSANSCQLHICILVEEISSCSDYFLRLPGFPNLFWVGLNYTTTHHYPPPLTTTHHQPKYNHHHPSPAKIYPLSPTSTHHHPSPPTSTHHQPKYIRHHSPPSTDSQNFFYKKPIYKNL